VFGRSGLLEFLVFPLSGDLSLSFRDPARKQERLISSSLDFFPPFVIPSKDAPA